MAQFVEKMKDLTVDADRFKNRNDKEVEEINSRQKDDSAVYIFPKDEVDDSVEMENVPENYSEPKPCESVASDSATLSHSHSDREISEITYDFKINAVPPEFQTVSETIVVHDDNDNDGGDMKGEVTLSSEEEEEEIITETIEIVPFSGKVLVEPEEEEEELITTTEIIEIPMPIKDEIVQAENEPVVERVPVVEQVQEEVIQPVQREVKIENKTEVKIENKVEIEKPEEPKEKEEFVLTFDDLNKVDFSLMRKKPKMQPKSRPPFQSTPEKRHTVSTLEEMKSNFGGSHGDGFVTPTKEHTVTTDDGSIVTEHGSVRGHRGEVKTKCSELGFSPSSEGEVEHVFETKSISMLNLPAFRTSDNTRPLEVRDDDVKVSKTEIVFSRPSNTNVLDNESINRTASTSSSLESSNMEETSYRKASVNDSGVEADSSSMDAQEALAAQHKQLQEQCAMWQVQLEQNKKLLASTQAVPTDDTSRQLQKQLETQIQMQQQMLKQMQESMEVLSVQQQQEKSMESNKGHPQKEEVVKQTVVKVETKPANVPPPPPALPNGKLTNNIELLNRGSADQTKQKSKTKTKKHIEPKLDPREELMIAIRNFGGRDAMKKVRTQVPRITQIAY